jgi:peptidoglycan/LPS O-acetylase OafA/YrhL
LTTATASHRFNELDSLRGLAAVTVALGHLALIVFRAPGDAAHPHWLFWRHFVMAVNRTPLAVLINGGAAVRFFFVLSGFVLVLPFLRRPHSPYLPYIVKRICRIYLPYLVAVGLAVVAIRIWGGYRLAGFSSSVNEAWTEPVRVRLLAQHVLMLGDFQVTQYNPVLWSLVQEMRISIVFPLIALAVVYCSSLQLILIVGVMEATAILAAVLFRHADLSLQSFPMTVHFAGLFFLGAGIARNREKLVAKVAHMSRSGRALLAVGTFLVYSMGMKYLWGEKFHDSFFRLMHRAALMSAPAADRLAGFGIQWVGDWVSALCAGVAICFALSDRRAKALLNHTLVLWTGRASYSLYLVHATVLYALLYALIGTRYLPWLVPLYLVLTTLVTAVFYRLVEVPAMRLGRKLSGAMQPVEAKKENASTAAAA